MTKADITQYKKRIIVDIEGTDSEINAFFVAIKALSDGYRDHLELNEASYDIQDSPK